MKFFIILISIVVSISSPSYSQWAPTNGPSGGEASDIVKVNEYLFINAGPGGVYRSADEANHWTSANSGLPKNPHCYALASTGDVLYAAIHANGVYKSTDFGASWVRAGMDLQGKTFYSLLADGNDVYAGSSDAGFYHSANAGATWSLKGAHLRQVSHFLLVEGNLFVAATNTSSIAGVYKSIDKGDNLVDINAPVTSINFMSGYDNAIYITGGQPTAISRDYGATWKTSSIGTTGHYFLSAIYAYEDRVMIPGGNSTLFISENEGEDWQTVTTLNYEGLVTAIYSEDNKVIIGGREGIYMSSDNAMSWVEKNEGLHNLIITQLKATDDQVFAGTGIGIFLSTNNGLTWNEKNNGLHDNSATGFAEGVVIKGIHLGPGYAITATGKGIFKLPDNAAAWSLKQALQNADVNNRFMVLAGDKDRVFASEQGHQHYSTSAGETWATRMEPRFNGIGIINAAVKGDTIVVMAHENILTSINFGVTWESSRILASYFYPNEAAFVADKVYIATYQGLFVSGNLNSWTSVTGLPTATILSVSATQNALYVGTDMGVYASYNAGLTWYPMNGGLVDGSIAPLAFNSDHAFVGTYGSSVWGALRSDLSVAPVITGLANPLSYTENQEVLIEIGDLEITDPDNEFPGDFTLLIKDGPHYQVIGNLVIPEANYSGVLDVALVVSDGRYESNEYIATVNLVTGMPETRDVFGLYPNPTNQTINFSTSGQVTSYSIVDVTGHRILYNENLQLQGEMQSIDVSQLPSGIYFIELRGPSVQRQRFFKY